MFGNLEQSGSVFLLCNQTATKLGQNSSVLLGSSTKHLVKALVSTVVLCHIFTNIPSQLFQINQLRHDGQTAPGTGQTPAGHNSGPSTTTRHAGLLTVPGQPVSPFD
jgi:hypothetical protein